MKTQVLGSGGSLLSVPGSFLFQPNLTRTPSSFLQKSLTYQEVYLPLNFNSVTSVISLPGFSCSLSHPRNQKECFQGENPLQLASEYQLEGSAKIFLGLQGEEQWPVGGLINRYTLNITLCGFCHCPF